MIVGKASENGLWLKEDGFRVKLFNGVFRVVCVLALGLPVQLFDAIFAGFADTIGVLLTFESELFKGVFRVV